MNPWQRLIREPNAVLGVVTATTGLLTLFGVPITLEQAGGILAFVGAIMFAVRFVSTPSAEVVARVNTDRQVVVGPAAVAPSGTPVPRRIPVQVKPELVAAEDD